MARNAVESRRDRIDLAHDAGFGAFSLGSVLSGTLVAYGAFAVLAAIAGGLLTAFGIDSANDLSGDFRDVGIGTGIVAAAVLFVSYLWGGYVAGRMARRAGVVNGLMVFVLGLLLAVGIGGAIGAQAGTDAITDNLRSIGVPTSGDEWIGLGTVAGLGAIAAMLLGSMLGGMSGERWHGKLLTRAMDPAVGPEVDVREPVAVAAAGGEHFDGDRWNTDDTSSTTSSKPTSTSTSTTLDEDLQRARR